MFQRLFPGDHPEVALGLGSVASCLANLGRYAEALSKAEEALAMTRQLFPTDHPMTAWTLISVANYLDSLGRTAEALPKFEEALAIEQRVNHETDRNRTAGTMANIAQCLVTLGRSEEALPKFAESLAMYQRLYPGDHPDLADCLNRIGNCLRSLGRPEEALPKHEEALTMFARVLPPDHWRIRIAEIGKGATLVDVERFPEAKVLLIPLWANIADRADIQKKHKIRCLDALVKLFEKLETIEPGQSHADEAAPWRAKLDEISKAESAK